MSGLARWLTGYVINSAWQIPVLAVCTAGLVKVAARGGARLQYRLWVSCLVLAIVVPALPAMRMPSFRWGGSVARTEAKGGGVVPAMNAGERIAIYTDAIVEPVRQGSGGRVLLWVYGLSVLVGVGRLGRKLWVTRAVMQGASRMVLPSARDAVLARLMEAFGIAKVAVYSSPRLRCPATVSWPGAVLLVPADFASVAEEEAVAAISHELAHVRRRDFAVNLACEVVAVFGFYHPVTHWVMRRIAEAREVVVDEMAAEATTGATAYAKALLSLAEGVCARSEARNLLLGVLERGTLEMRIMRLIDVRLPWGRSYRFANVVCCWILFAGFGAGAASLNGVLSGSRMLAQASAVAAPTFVVASIRPCQDPSQRPSVGHEPAANSSPGRLATDCAELLNLIGNAYVGYAGGRLSMDSTPVTGGPAWLHSAFYEINARAEGAPSVDMMRGPMMQALLEDRFQLKIHRQRSEGAVYVLSVARGGPKLRSFTEGSCTPYSTFPSPPRPGQGYCRSVIGGIAPSVDAQGATLDEFSKLLRTVLGRPVIDKTGITGRFDIHVDFSREGTKLAGVSLMPAADGSAASDSTGPPSIFTALQEQLGLRLEPAKGPVESFVIDSIERPSEN